MDQQHGGERYTKEYRIDLSICVNPLGMPERVAEAAAEGLRLSSRYPDTGCHALRQALSVKLGLPEKSMIFGNGAAELLYALAGAVRPRKALLAAPSFSEYERSLSSAGCSIDYITLREEDGFALPAGCEDMVTEDLDILILCNPNNPTGVLIPRSLLEALLARCEEKRVLLVVDECFLGLTGSGEDHSMRRYVPESRQLFILDAFTKLYAMPGLRLGYGLCGSRDLLRKMRCRLQPWNVSLPAQCAGVAALNEDDYVLRGRELIAAERQYLGQALESLGFSTVCSAANYIMFKGPADLADRLAERAILIRDLRALPGLDPGWFRVAVGTHSENSFLIDMLRELSQIWPYKKDNV